MSRVSRLRKAVRDRTKRTRELAALLRKEERAGRWRQKRTEKLRKLAKRSPEDLKRFRGSRARLRTQRVKVGRLRKLTARSRAKLSSWKLALSRAQGGSGANAVRYMLQFAGKVETGRNDADWLRAWENSLPHNRLDWMIPGNPYCGLGCIVAWWKGARKLLPDDTVSTVAIANRARSGNGYRSVPFSQIRVGDLIVMHFGSGGPKHVGLARGPMRGGVVPTVEANTSPGNSGSQSNGGGVWTRSRPRAVIHTVARPK